MILRMAQSYIYKKYGTIRVSAEHLQEVIDIYIKPIHAASSMLEKRALIRESKHLNKLLYDNLHALKHMFKVAKLGGDGFTLPCAKEMLLPLKHADYSMSLVKVEESFVLCMMTVIDEESNMKKYRDLCFVEFLDFLCRIAIVGITMQDLIEYKVHLLLEILFQAFYEAEEMNTRDHPLKEVDEKCNFN